MPHDMAMLVVCWCALQAIGWTLFALTAAYIGAMAKLLVAGVMVCLRCWLLGASVLMIATQLVGVRSVAYALLHT